MRSKVKAVALALLATATFGAGAQQDSGNSSHSVQKATVTLDGGYLYINAAGDAFQISGPGGFSASSNQPTFDFGGEVPNGIYTFAVYASSGQLGEVSSETENLERGRDITAVPGQVKTLVVSGKFQVTDNTISIKE